MRVLLHDDLRRSRLTVFFRLLLAIPHLVWFGLWGYVALFTAFLGWLCALVTGRLPESFHRFLSAFLRYGFHLGAYLHLTANPFPGFLGERGYPADLELPGIERQPRLTVLLRGVLGLPAIVLGGVLAGWAQGGLTYSWLVWGGGLATSVAMFGWFAALATGRMPRGLRDLGTYGLGYGAQLWAYLFLLTPRYPSADPHAQGSAWELPGHPVALHLDDDRRRSRLTVFFRFLLVLPHLVWLTLWSPFALLASVVNWIFAVFAGRSWRPLHRFLGAFIRYQAQVSAFLFLVANPFPGFVGARGYPVEPTLPELERQSRWTIGFRHVLIVPALLLTLAFGSALYVVGILGWFAALVTGRMPGGLRNLGAISLRYTAQTYAYGAVLTGRYPDASPAVVPPPEPEPEREPELEPALLPA